MVLCQGATALAGDFVGDSGYRPSIWKAFISAKTSVFSVCRDRAASSQTGTDSDALFGYVSIIFRPENLTIGSKSLSAYNNTSWW
jgi:hypothetical protein